MGVLLQIWWRSPLLLWLLLASPAIAAEVPSPLSPEESLRHLQVDEGLKVELVACEPEVVDPIAIRFDEDGRLWVVQMRDYPHGPPPGQPPLSSIRVLTDTDGDGRYETSQVFAEQLLFPTGIQPWRGGVIVTLAGQVAYLKDTDGDGRADLHKTLFTGFVEENPQLRANHPRLGLDHRVYVANGLRGGTIVDASRPDAAAIPISGMDFCFDPHSGQAAAVTGNGQFGLTFDDFGSRFVCNNRQPLEHVVLENRYVARNPFLAVPSLLASVAAGGESSRIFPLTAAWTTSNLHAGQFTAACGVEIYRGDALGEAYRGNAFVCEPTGSLVHREVLSPASVTFRSRPGSEGREFLASPDSWFRPVNLELGPDGALYVADMYRAVIEHPQFMPSELQNRPDLRLGDDRGRIYRIVRADAAPPRRVPKLSKATTSELVALLEGENAWWRETAARLLYERQDAAAKAPLERLAVSAARPASRVQALWALAGLNALADEILFRALGDDDPHVREQSIVLSEARLDRSPALRLRVLALAQDAEPRVRFRVALAIGGLSEQKVVEPLAAIALRSPEDVWIRRAVATALPERIAPLVEHLWRTLPPEALAPAAPEHDLVRELAGIVGARRESTEIQRLLELVLSQTASAQRERQLDALAGLATGVERRGGRFWAFVSDAAGDHSELTDRLQNFFHEIASTAADVKRDDAERLLEIELLRFAPDGPATESLLQMVAGDSSQDLRLSAVAALAHHPADRVAPALLANFSPQTPAMRRAILDTLLAQPASSLRLLEAIASEEIARTEIDAARATRLRESKDPNVHARAREILPAIVTQERRKVLADYQAALALKPEVRAGQELFRKHCAGCHRIGNLGVNVAPDISDSRVKTPEQLLTDILNPNQAIDNNYVSYTVVTHDGAVHTGIIAAETASSLTLRQAENKTVSVLRADIETIRSQGVSLMPEGFERDLTHQQMADLIGFVKNWRYLEHRTPGLEFAEPEK